MKKSLQIPEIKDTQIIFINVTRQYRTWKTDELAKDDRIVFYHLIRRGWKLDTNLVPYAKYIFAIANGSVVAVYSDLKWSPILVRGWERLAFEGTEVFDSPYIGLDISQYIRVQNPVRYVNFETE